MASRVEKLARPAKTLREGERKIYSVILSELGVIRYDKLKKAYSHERLLAR